MKYIILLLTVFVLARPLPVYGQDHEEQDHEGQDYQSAAVIDAIAPEFADLITSAADTYTMWCNASALNVRKEPSPEAEILDQLMYLGSVEAVAEYDGWTCIAAANGIAFVKSEYLSDEETIRSVADTVPDGYRLVPLGEFRITHYCCEKYKHICGTGTGLTASGVPLEPGMVSTDPNVIPTGSRVMFRGQIYTAYDTGGKIKGNRIDLSVDTHQHALDLGVYYTDVYLLEEE